MRYTDNTSQLQQPRATQQKQTKVEALYTHVLLSGVWLGNKGLYWKTSTDTAVHFSNSSTDIQKDVTFASPEQFFAHRGEHGFPEDWSLINTVGENQTNSNEWRLLWRSESVATAYDMHEFCVNVSSTAQ